MAALAHSENALKIFQARYLDDEAPTVDRLFRRVSGGNESYFQLMNQGLFLPNSPTLFNAGKKQGGTLSACFVFDLMDALLGDWPDGGKDMPFATSIAGTAFKAMAVAKAGGGVGYYLGNIRKKNAEVKSTHKRACGPVIVLRWLNTLNWLITQGGKRALAQMGILDAHHEDIREFIHCKDENPEELSSFNISVSWRNEMLNKIDWDSVGKSPTSYEGSLWWEQCQSAWKTGDPGMYFWTTTNLHNATPHLGDINATNPCGETPNISDEPCNLGSLSLLRFLKKVGVSWVFDWDKFKQAVKTAIRFMDDILDWNVFPHPDITKTALATRKLGLGVMGFAATLNMMHIPYDCQDAVDWGGNLMKTLTETAREESRQMGVTKGVYPAWHTASDAVKRRFPAMRNSTVSSIAPTGTIFLLADAETSGIEPYFALETDRVTGEGIKLREKAASIGLSGGHVPKTANQVSIEWHIKHQAAFQEHTDLGVSKTINLPNSATAKDVSDAYRMMWETGCKGGTVFRDGCRNDQVLRDATKKKTSVYVEGSDTTPQAIPIRHEDFFKSEEFKAELDKYLSGLDRHLVAVDKPKNQRKLPRERSGTTIKFSIGGTEGYITPNVYPDGTLGEIFIELANDGSTLAGMVKSFAKTFSVALQNGTPLESLIKLHKNAVFEPRGLTGDAEVPNCTSITDYIVRKLEVKFLGKSKPPQPVNTDTGVAGGGGAIAPLGGPDYTAGIGLTGQFCPDCGAELIRGGSSCMNCTRPGCGYSKC